MELNKKILGSLNSILCSMFLASSFGIRAARWLGEEEEEEEEEEALR